MALTMQQHSDTVQRTTAFTWIIEEGNEHTAGLRIYPRRGVCVCVCVCVCVRERERENISVVKAQNIML